MNLTVNIYGDEIVAESGDLIIRRSLSSVVKDWFAPPPPPKEYWLNERELRFLLNNLQESTDNCPERRVKFGLFFGGLGTSLYVIDGDDHKYGGSCPDCDCW